MAVGGEHRLFLTAIKPLLDLVGNKGRPSLQHELKGVGELDFIPSGPARFDVVGQSLPRILGLGRKKDLLKPLCSLATSRLRATVTTCWPT